MNLFLGLLCVFPNAVRGRCSSELSCHIQENKYLEWSKNLCDNICEQLLCKIIFFSFSWVSWTLAESCSEKGRDFKSLTDLPLMFQSGLAVCAAVLITLWRRSLEDIYARGYSQSTTGLQLRGSWF